MAFFVALLRSPCGGRDVAGRLLYGYQLADRVIIDPPRASVVVAVLSARKQSRFGLSAHFVRQLAPDLSDAAIFALIRRIRAHCFYYYFGIARDGLAPEVRLVISGQMAAPLIITPSAATLAQANEPRHHLATVRGVVV